MSTKKLENGRRSGRDRLQMLYGHLYEFDPREDRMKCCYCGDVRECVDHVPALHVVDMLGSKKVRELDVDFFLYPSCSKCNSTLHTSFLLTYEERLSFEFRGATRLYRGASPAMMGSASCDCRATRADF